MIGPDKYRPPLLIDFQLILDYPYLLSTPRRLYGRGDYPLLYNKKINKSKSVALQALTNLGPAEQLPLAVFPDCTRRYWVDMWSTHRIPRLHFQLSKPVNKCLEN
jgi:hypothetical protein